MGVIETTAERVRSVYEVLERNVTTLRKRLARPLTYAEKIFPYWGRIPSPASI